MLFFHKFILITMMADSLFKEKNTNYRISQYIFLFNVHCFTFIWFISPFYLLKLHAIIFFHILFLLRRKTQFSIERHTPRIMWATPSTRWSQFWGVVHFLTRGIPRFDEGYTIFISHVKGQTSNVKYKCQQRRKEKGHKTRAQDQQKWRPRCFQRR